MGKRLPLKSMRTVGKHRYILQKLSKASPTQRKTMLSNAPSQLFSVFKTICKLITGGHLNLGKAKRHKKLANKISSSKASSIKGMTKQHGGAIASIIAGVLPFLIPLISKIFK